MKICSRRSLCIVLVTLPVMAICDAVYLYSRVPDWSVYAHGMIPKSSFMLRYEQSRAEHRNWPTLHWRPIPFNAMPKHLRRAAVVAEDSRFYEHDGFDLIAFREAMALNLKKGRLAYGASTISQQTVKNLFLSSARDPLRKWHELVLTMIMEQRLSKSRILEIYLNIAEFGRGIYGVEAAAQYYFNKPAVDLTLTEAVALAASLPSPVKSNPASHSSYFMRHRDTILARMLPPEPEPGTAESVLPTLELDAAPTPEEEEPADGNHDGQQSMAEEAPSTVVNVITDVAPLPAANDDTVSDTPY